MARGSGSLDISAAVRASSTRSANTGVAVNRLLLRGNNPPLGWNSPQLGKLELGKPQLGESELGKSQLGESELGKLELGLCQLGPLGLLSLPHRLARRGYGR